MEMTELLDRHIGLRMKVVGQSEIYELGRIQWVILHWPDRIIGDEVWILGDREFGHPRYARLHLHETLRAMEKG